MKLVCTLRCLIEETFTAAAFAEEGQHETARELLRKEEAERAARRAAAIGGECCLRTGAAPAV